MTELFKALAIFLHVVACAAGVTDLSLGSSVNGSLVSGQVQYNFTYSHTSTDQYQFIYVLPEVSSNPPMVTIAEQGVSFNTDLQCSASASSANGQVTCSYSFQGCVMTTQPDFYTITVSPPSGLTADISFTVGAVNVDAVLTAAINTRTKLSTCCGFKGAAWHYVKALDTEVISSISLTVTNGTLTTYSLSSGLTFLQPGIFIIPDGLVCTNFDLFSVITNIGTYVKSLLSFSANLSADSSSPTVVLELSSELQLPGVSYWVLVVPNQDSSAEYSISADYSGGSSASTLSSASSVF